MKFSILTIAGALATANASSAVRGDAAKKIVLMQQIADAANKKMFEAASKTRRLDGKAYITSETVIQPRVCITAKVYGYEGEAGGADAENGGNYYNTANGPYMSYLTWEGETSASYGDVEYVYGNDDEYTSTLADYVQAIGSSYAEEKANLCDDCSQMQTFCQMSDDERAYFADMSEDEFQAYLANIEEEYEQENQKAEQEANKQQQQNEANEQQAANNAYAAYSYNNGGNRRLFESIQTLCGTCQNKCINNQNYENTQEYYENMEKLFEENMCTEAGNGYYIGHTCGGNGKSIELAQFTDENCMYMASDQNAYNVYNNAVAQVYQNDADGDGYNDNTWEAKDLGYGYMEMVTDLFSQPFSCQTGAVRSYDGSDASEACQNLYGNSVSKKQCAYGGNQDRKLQDEEQQQFYNTLPSGYDMLYSEDLYDVCSTIFSNEASAVNNPFQGDSFAKLFGLENGSLSGGAIAGIVIAVLAVVAVAAVVIKKKTEKKTDLEEPVFQGGALQ